MSSALFETRFFIHFFASPEPSTHRQLLELMRKYDTRLVSAMTLFEIYKLSLEREGKETAEIRTSRMRNEFDVIPVDDLIAVRGAQLKHAVKVRYNEDVPMADSLIAATSVLRKAVCVTDSPHLKKIPQVKCRWT
jgi:predicted nucleic acid-binding protein